MIIKNKKMTNPQIACSNIKLIDPSSKYSIIVMNEINAAPNSIIARNNDNSKVSPALIFNLRASPPLEIITL
jgi:hypothetical protein